MKPVSFSVLRSEPTIVSVQLDGGGVYEMRLRVAVVQVLQLDQEEGERLGSPSPAFQCLTSVVLEPPVPPAKVAQ